MKTARAFLRTQAELTTHNAAASRRREAGRAPGLGVAVFACFSVVAACSVYDESLLPTGPIGGGGSSTGGALGSGGTTPSDDAPVGSGGAGGVGGTRDASMPTVDSSQGGASVSGTGGSGNGGSSVMPDVAVNDVADVVVADRSDVSVPPMCPLLIDNMESGLGQINDGCRNGFWFTFNDGTVGGSQTPPANSAFAPQVITVARAGSMRAAHTAGSGYTSAGMGVNFNSPPGASRGVYNASAYVGVTFWAIGTGMISMSMPNRDTDPAGGVCGDGGRGGCYDHFQTSLILSSTTWQQYTFTFSELRQKGFGYAPVGGFDKTAVYGVQWGITMGGAFDFWIDDVSFITSVSDAAGQ
jgi:hypothetical protein